MYGAQASRYARRGSNPHRLRRIGDIENDYAFVAIGEVKPIAIFLNLVAGDHLVAAVWIFAVGFGELLAHMLADDVKARDKLRLRRRIVIENVELLDLDLLLRLRRGAAHIDVAVVHLHAVGETAAIEPFAEQLGISRVGN